jgi:hypothetical protein
MKRYHQTTAMLLACGLLLGSVPYTALADTPAVAAPAILTQLQAVEKAKAILPAGHEYEMLEVTLEGSSFAVHLRNRPYWQFLFADKNHPTEPYSVQIDAENGRMLSYNKQWRDKPAQTLTRTEALAKAQAVLQKYAPEQAAFVREEPSTSAFRLGDTSQTFRFVRMQGGVPFPHDAITVTLQGDGELESYNITWTDGLEFPDAAPKLTAVEAKERFAATLNLHLVYQELGYRSSKEYRPAYLPNVPAPYHLPVIEATTGELLDGNGEPTTPLPVPKPLTDHPAPALQNMEFTQEQAQDRIKALPIDLKGYTLDESHYGEFDQKDWSFRYHNENADTVTFEIDGRNGTLKRYELGQTSARTSLLQPLSATRAQARTAAIDFVRKALPSLAPSLTLDESLQEMPYSLFGYTFQFTAMQDGIPVSSSGIIVSVDPHSGALYSLKSASEGTTSTKQPIYAPATDVISADDARARYLERYPLTLQYVPVYAPLPNTWSEPQVQSVRLAYRSNAGSVTDADDSLNAKTGQWDVRELMPAQRPKATDIKGHWAEKELSQLIQEDGLPLQNGKVFPDAPVSRGDLARAIVASQGTIYIDEEPAFTDVPLTDPNYDYVESAYHFHWIDRDASTFRPQDTISRAELAEILVNMLGYRKVAEHPDLFRARFTDVADNSAHYAAISLVHSFGLMTMNAGAFHPDQKVTKAQLAVTLDRLSKKWYSLRLEPSSY